MDTTAVIIAAVAFLSGGTVGIVVKFLTGRRLSTDAKLWKRLDEMTTEAKIERLACDKRIEIIEARGDAFEKLSVVLQAEVKDLRGLVDAFRRARPARRSRPAIKKEGDDE